MPDVCMCNGVNCPLRMTCYRFRATPSFWQSYFTSEAYDEKTKRCEYYDKIREADVIKRERRH